MKRSLSLGVAFLIIGLSSLVVGVSTGFSHEWQLDIINTITIAAAVLQVGLAIFAKTPGVENESVHSQHS
ncbi:MAG: hypothetical protein ACXVI3_03485 [Halobacteriota archaeon]